MQELINVIKKKYNEFKNSINKSKEKFLKVEEIKQEARSKCWALEDDKIRNEIIKIESINLQVIQNFKKVNKNIRNSFINFYLVFFIMITIFNGVFDLMFLIQILLHIGIDICVIGFLTECIKWYANEKMEYKKEAYENELRKRMKFEFLKSKQEYDSKQEIETYEPIKSLEDEKDKNKTK